MQHAPSGMEPEPHPGPSHTHHAGCRPAGALAGGFASPHNSDTGWLRALRTEWRSLDIAGRGSDCSQGGSQALALACCPGYPPACLHTLPLGSPSCCSSLDKDSPSTLCLAALERMKLSTATVALTSPDSGGTRGWGKGVSLWPQPPSSCPTIFSSQNPGLLEP